MTTNDMVAQVIETTEARVIGTRDWECLADCVPMVRDTICQAIIEAMCRDMRHEEAGGNTDESGRLEIDGQVWEYAR